METRVAVSVLVFLMTGLDVVLTRKKESEFVWTKPFRLTLVRFLYLLARYLALLILLVEITFMCLITAEISETKQAPEYSCLSLLTFQCVSSQCMLLVLHLILMLRVLALYHQSLFIGAPVSLLIIGRFTGVTAGVLHGLARTPSPLKFSGPCLIEVVPGTSAVGNPFLPFVFGELFTQVILHGLAWKRTIWDLRVFASRPAWFSVLNRDNLNVFIGIAVAMIAMTVSAVKNVGMADIFIFPLWITFLSFAATRIILNLHTLDPSDGTSSSKPMELTTITDVSSWDEPWDTTTFQNTESELCSDHSEQDIASL
ncbi:hypothetical protein GYMLUDRAFT_45761 [Collybiopsis luxurians FD-317 M1]|uniref:DUF6533 domain-containing protein n=1 Tax=Collybiopsis luxurians FD-317 M1 TaxID=944289 RepID=A0A0D0CR08_9AGAR|nr:hypothetical protein GYMLUDRAFT_45761 [Collybiopsis luxurians FD-317 M1]